MQIDHKIYKWLGNHKIIGISDKIQGVNAKGIYELDINITKQLENGIKIAQLLNKINQNNHSYIGQLTIDKLKDSDNPASRLYNWNLINEAMKKMGISLDQDVKSLIVAGDTQMLAEVIKDLYDYDDNQLETISIPNSANSIQSNPRRKQNKRNNLYEAQRKDQILSQQFKSIVIFLIQNIIYLPIIIVEDNQKTVDLNNLDVNKKLDETSCLLEFFLIAISKFFMLQPKQSASLLANGNKYFAHVIIKGLKGDFNPVEDFFQEIYANISRLMIFIEIEEGNIPILLNTLKPGFLSKNEEVVMWTCRILSKIAFDLTNLELLAPAYSWFCQQMGGLYSCVMCLQRHNNVQDNLVSFILQISRFNLLEVLTVQLRKIIENNREYINFINQLFSSLCYSKSCKEELIRFEIIQFWTDLCFNISENDPLNIKIQDRECSLQLLVNIWKQFPLYIQEGEYLQEKILELLKKGTRDKNQNFQMGCLNKLFDILDFLASDRNPLASLIYKKLTFSLVENHMDITLRDYMLQNFTLTFQKFQTIPTEILLEPLIKQIQISDNKSYFFNICDVEFFQISSQHSKLSLQMGIQLIDLLLKVYFNNLIFAQSVFNSIENIIQRFIKENSFQEYLIKLIVLSLSQLLNSCKGKKNIVKFQKDQKNIFDAIDEQNSVQIINAQKRGLIIQLFKVIIQQKQFSLNSQIKPLIVKLFIDLKNIKIEYKGLLILLNLLDSPESIMREIDFQNQLDNKENVEKGNFQRNYKDKNQQEIAFYDNDITNKIYENNNNQQNQFQEDIINDDYISKNDQKSYQINKNDNLNSKAIMQIELIKQQREIQLLKKKQEEELKNRKKIFNKRLLRRKQQKEIFNQEYIVNQQMKKMEFSKKTHYLYNQKQIKYNQLISKKKKIEIRKAQEFNQKNTTKLLNFYLKNMRIKLINLKMENFLDNQNKNLTQYHIPIYVNFVKKMIYINLQIKMNLVNYQGYQIINQKKQVIQALYLLMILLNIQFN
ncbi:hypothetical protein IMG5_030700 [Ichthyophthirius multifiliis]|uniref:Calponin-homology (CH) domain-containing protein n=1 Tax=Ichthyophthirius multifiliis TaxID=5932 RepID=G0QLI0_ICHMU|nr:hypothetical protein IMG5_030700 [Ichthyophthirius multifiliis]EGR33928.1 hypothetical protein IMG5_030700 [Ichthyophthirius multifiliis]|eukprot:XP_004039232.1 hypothetical protein IMG5_030700 [Ichthyophthirius multifiliis]